MAETIDGQRSKRVDKHSERSFGNTRVGLAFDALHCGGIHRVDTFREPLERTTEIPNVQTSSEHVQLQGCHKEPRKAVRIKCWYGRD